MQWNLRFLPQLEFLEGLIEDGEPELVSEEFRTRPQLLEHQGLVLEAFMILSRGRTSGMSTNPISITEMSALIQMHPALWYTEPIELIMIWRNLDDICLKFWQEQERAKEKKRQEPIPAP